MFSRRSFTDQFRCHSVSLLAAEQQREVSRLEYSDKIILPPSCLERLAQLEIQYPMIFEIANPRYLQRRLHCGVLEFIAQEGMVYLPFWMMENMHLNEGDVIHLRSASLLKGSFVKLQPQTSDFTLISNPKAVLEKSLGSFSALTKGETFRIFYNNKKYNIGVVEVRPEGGRFPSNSPEAVCIIEADVQVDFEAPADYVEPPRPSPPQSSPLSSPPLTKSPLVGPSLGNPRIDNDSSDEEMTCKPKFTGSGFRLDGKPIKTPKYSGGKNSSADTLNGGCNSTAPKLSVRIGGDGSLIGGSENALGARDTASNAGTGTTTTAGAGTGTGSGNSVLGRTLSGATVPLPDLSANQEQDGRGEIGSEMRCLGLRGATSSASDTAHHRTLDSDANNSASDGLALERIGSHADAIKRLGKAAETPARGDAYWASLGIGKKIRD